MEAIHEAADKVADSLDVLANEVSHLSTLVEEVRVLRKTREEIARNLDALHHMGAITDDLDRLVRRP